MYRLNSLNADIQLIVDGASANNPLQTTLNNLEQFELSLSKWGTFCILTLQVAYLLVTVFPVIFAPYFYREYKTESRFHTKMTS